MSDQAGISSQVISVPKGGGALRSIGEKFSPNLHTGTGNLTVPLSLPAGRNNFQPDVNLVYSTGNGNGPFGLGWNLGIPSVSRKTAKGVPVYDDSKDVFILSATEDLVPIAYDLDTTVRYRPRTEAFFSLIDHHRGSGDDYWRVRTRDGLTSLYGSQAKAGADPAVVADPSDRSKVFAWKLTRTLDPFGNCIEYEYERELLADGPHHWDQLYLKQIRYGDYTESGEVKYLISVTFKYEDRPDPFSDYRAGFEIRTTKRCVSIEIWNHAGADCLARTYDLTYLDQVEDPRYLPPNGVSLLSRIKVTGYDEACLEELPPLEFRYSKFEPEKRDFFPLTGDDRPPASLARPEYELADLFGRGVPDVVEMNGTVRYWRNLGGGKFDLPREMRTAPAGFSFADKGVQLADANGDGRLDLLIANGELAGYFPLRFGGLWDDRSFQRYRAAPSFSLDDPEVRLVDLNGDGVTDAIRSGTRLECFFNDGIEGWTHTRFVERRSLDVFPNVNFSDPHVKWADMTGDGLQDIVLLYNGSIAYWPNLGHGNWGGRVFMRDCPRFPDKADPARILIGDVDGDGLADVIYVEDAKVTLWINCCGNGWSDPIEIHGTPRVSAMDAVRLSDMLGTGINGVLWTSDAATVSHENMFFLDFTGGIKAYLLNEVDNNIGSVTRIGYSTSTRFYLDDEKRSETRWKTALPFPVHVVAQVEVIDKLSTGKLTMQYSYHHGYWDGAEREFCGFGRVDQRDTESFEDYHGAGLHDESQSFNVVEAYRFSPPTETRTWFHQGPIGDEFGGWEETDFTNEFWPGDPQVFSRPQEATDFLKGLPRRVKRDALRALRGSMLRTELYAIDGTQREHRPYTVTEYLYGIMPLPLGEPWPDEPEPWRNEVFFPHKLAERTTQWERGDDPLTRLEFIGNYDEYGQPRSQIDIAVPRGRDYRQAITDYQQATNPVEPYLVAQSLNTYAHTKDDQLYIVDRVAVATSYEIINDGEVAGDPRPSALKLAEYVHNGLARKEIFGNVLSFYDGEAFEGLPLGEVGQYGAPVRTESLALTKEILHEAYRSGSELQTPAEEPPYLAPGGPPLWTADYPLEFRAMTQELAGYRFRSGGPDPVEPSGYFVATMRCSYDFHEIGGGNRGLVKIRRDPLGRDTHIAFDAFDLLPIAVTDQAGLTSHAVYNYRSLQLELLTDPNCNRTAFTYTPLGLLKSASIMGKAAESAGDTPEAPSLEFTYNFMAFSLDGQPISVSTTRRVHHVNDDDVPLPERDETIKSIEYSDGFGRLLQTRLQAEETAFGDPIFGGALLPADQSTVPGDVVGQKAAAALPRVVVSGWHLYDNKGRVVEKYEPFFSTGWDYAPAAEAQLGSKTRVFYDPRGQAIRTVYPNNSEQRVIYGVPADLSDPEQFAPTVWEVYTYDVNDNAGRTHPAASSGYDNHWNTPSSTEVDALGRKVKTIVRNGPDPSADRFITRSTYDIRGNLLSVTDQLGRLAFRNVYDLANNPLRAENIDAGVMRIVLDAGGQIVEQRDSKGAVILYAHDILSRLFRLWARDDANGSVTLRSRLEYGDGSDPNQPAAERQANQLVNRVGKLYKHYDEAGLLTIEAYDFKSAPSQKVRRVISDAAILSSFDPPPPDWDVNVFRVDWEPPAGKSLEDYADELLDATPYQTSFASDALGRLKIVQYPQDVEGGRRVLRPRYNRAGALESVELGDAKYVEHIAYNAKGQRVFIAYANAVMTRYAYDPQTFRPVRMRSERYSMPPNSALTFHPDAPNNPLQDIAYDYDLAGNLLRIEDRTPGSGVKNNPQAMQAADPQLAQLLVKGDALIRRFDYDPLYRLLSATGRECKNITKPRPWTDEQWCGFNSGNLGTPNQDNAPDLTASYKEEYTYDPAGNLVSLKHKSNGGVWTRHFGMGGLAPQAWSEQWPLHLSATDEWVNPPGNRLTHVGDDSPVIAQTHFYDVNGNLKRETTSRHFEWDHSDRMRAYRTQTEGAEPSVHAHYLYDVGGQRVKKLVRKGGGNIEVTIYIDGVFEHHRIVKASSTQENNTLHVMDNQSRVALVRVGAPFPDDNGPAVRFHLGDHLGSSSLVVDSGGAWINREEYTPYGETSLGSFARKRYRFTGKERDEESGLYYHGARYYAPWLGRWASCDPAGMVDGVNIYAYVRNNPVMLTDNFGTQSDPREGGGGAGGAGAGSYDGGGGAGGVERAGAGPNDGGGGAEGAGSTSYFHPLPEEPPASLPECYPGLGDCIGDFGGDIILLLTTGGIRSLGLAAGATEATMTGATETAMTGGTKAAMSTGKAETVAARTLSTAPKVEVSETSLLSKIEFEVAKANSVARASSEASSTSAIVIGNVDDAIVRVSAQKMAERTGQRVIKLGEESLEGLDEITLFGHGANPRGLGAADAIDLGRLGTKTADELSELLVASNWRGGTLRLGSCGAGLVSPRTGAAFGEAVSMRLGQLGSGSTVVAPMGRVTLLAPGEVGVPLVMRGRKSIILGRGKGWAQFDK